MQINDRLKLQFGSWLSSFSKFIESEEFDRIFATLKNESQVKKAVITPDSSNLFKSLERCNKEKVKALVLLQDPYAKILSGNVKLANGVPMCCAVSEVKQPSLYSFHEAIEESLGEFTPKMDYGADIGWLLEEEHVLLLNSSLTVEANKPGSHSELWKKFMIYFIQEIINKEFKTLPIVLVGANAQSFEKYIVGHPVLCVEHPAAASYQNRKWQYKDMFRWIDNIIQQNHTGGLYSPIQWWREKEKPKDREPVGEKVDEDNMSGDLPWMQKQ